MTAEELARRLITLIFAGRNRMDMIRRELPRTKRAGWGRNPYRIERKEGSPFRGPCAIIGSAVLKTSHSFLRRGCELLLLFRVHRNRPDESKQFTPKRSDDLVFVLASCCEGLVSLV